MKLIKEGTKVKIKSGRYRKAVGIVKHISENTFTVELDWTNDNVILELTRRELKPI